MVSLFDPSTVDHIIQPSFEILNTIKGEHKDCHGEILHDYKIADFIIHKIHDIQNIKPMVKSGNKPCTKQCKTITRHENIATSSEGIL